MQEAARLPDELPIGIDLAVGPQVADHVPVQAGVVLAAAYLLWLYQRVFFGELTNPANAKLSDLTFREARDS